MLSPLEFSKLSASQKVEYLDSLTEFERKEFSKLIQRNNNAFDSVSLWRNEAMWEKLGKLLCALLAIAVVIAALLLLYKCESNKPVSGSSSWSDSPASRTENAFNQARAALALAVRENLKDPNSFQQLSATRSIDGGDMVVVIEYTASNSFGARVKNTAIATCRIDGSNFRIVQLFASQ